MIINIQYNHYKRRDDDDDGEISHHDIQEIENRIRRCIINEFNEDFLIEIKSIDIEF